MTRDVLQRQNKKVISRIVSLLQFEVSVIKKLETDIHGHSDADKQGPKYWNYSVNEMGTEDCLAQIDHIHVTKCQELHVNAGPPPVKDTRQESFSIDQSPVTARA